VNFVSLPSLRKQLANYNYGAVAPFFLLHVGCLAVFFVHFRWRLVLILLLSYGIRMFGVTAGYHRYFSHRTYKLNRVNQFLLAFLAQTSSQKGVLWWAAHHRDHHQNSDMESDIHSPMHSGFWWSHVGWVISNEYDSYDEQRIRDFAKFRELRWLDRYHWLPTALLGAAFYLTGGMAVFVWGYVLATVLLFHGTFSINSLAHIWGTRRFPTRDQSRNNFLLALVTLGEGWHNNHHQFMYACRQGLRWWEVDITYYLIKLLSWIGMVREIRAPRVLEEPLAKVS
jgi:stearoyl-CoA desaturase (delta-9 desaturase)